MMKDINIKDIDSILTVLDEYNKNSNKTKEQSITVENNNYNSEEEIAQIITETTKKSTGNHGRISKANEQDVKVVPSQKTLLGTWLSVGIVSAAILIELTAGIKTVSHVFDTIDTVQTNIQSTVQNVQDSIARYNDTNKAVNTLISNAKQILLQKKLAQFDERYYGNPVQILENSVNDYKKLNVDNYVDVYIYKKILDENEFSKFIKSVSYIDANGNIYYYTDFEQFLYINGFKDEKTFENYAQSNIYNLYIDGKLYAFDINEQTIKEVYNEINNVRR